MLLLALLVLSACTTGQIHYYPPSQGKPFMGITALYIDRFKGEKSSLLRDLLIREIEGSSFFEYLEDYPDATTDDVALINAEVRVLSIRDVDESRPQTTVVLMNRQVAQAQSSGELVKKQAVEFIENQQTEKLLHRTIDLEIEFEFTKRTRKQPLAQKRLLVSYQQVYTGEDRMLLIPDPEDEVIRLGGLMMRRLVDEINPVAREYVVALDPGTVPVPWTMGFVSFGHPRIVEGIGHAEGGDYALAIKVWNTVLYAPQPFPEQHRFAFTTPAYVELRATEVPKAVMSKLLRLRGQTFDEPGLDMALHQRLSRENVYRYGILVKAHTRVPGEQEARNRLAVHYNLGVVHQLAGNLPLAAHHFAQANLLHPDPKYAQAWTDTQVWLGDYNPLDPIAEQTIDAAGRRPPPETTMIRPVRLEARQFPVSLASGAQTTGSGAATLKPVELPRLSKQTQSQAVTPMQTDADTQPVQPLTLE